jgi:hypothetical protein
VGGMCDASTLYGPADSWSQRCVIDGSLAGSSDKRQAGQVGRRTRSIKALGTGSVCNSEDIYI